MADTFVKIAAITVGAGAGTSVTFSSIPQTYTDLLIKVSARSSKGGTNIDNFSIQLNGSTSNFVFRSLYGTGSSVGIDSGTNVYGALLGTAATATANTFGNAEAYILNYTSSNYKSMSNENANENNATSALSNLNVSLWQDTTAVTSITIGAGGGNIEQYSTFTLYGILKA